MKYARLAWLGSVGLMIGVVIFQYGMDMRPCQLCIYQRWPHVIAIALGAYAIWARKMWLFPILGVVILIGAGIAFYHSGVEQHWWAGLQSCSGGGASSFDELMGTAPARCDEIPWSFLGLSMATWNGLISLGIAAFWFLAWKRD